MATAPKPELRSVAILGAGPAGLATGHELSTNGVRVTVLDRNPYVGGLCRTVEVNGYKFDLGGHRWFTKNADLNRWFERLMDGELVHVNRVSRIYHDGVFYSYPIAFTDILAKASLPTVLHAGLSFIAENIRRAFAPTPILNMEDAYTAQFGRKLFRMFFEQYSEKLWGRPCTELSADWVSQRSKGLSIWSVLGEALAKPKGRHVSLIEAFMYPRDGYMRIPERMAEDIAINGGDIKLSHTVTRVICHGENDFEVCYATADGREGHLRATHVVSTIPLGLLARIFEPHCPKEVEDAARGMTFRDLITVNLMLRRRRVTADTWIYVQDRSILFGRLHEPKNWSRTMVPDDAHTSLVLECFCSQGDELWSMNDEAIARRCIDDLVNALKFIHRDEVENWVVVRTPQAYPVYDLQYREKIETVMRFLRTHPGIEVVGRGGAFRYNNADHSIEMGLLLARRLLGEQIDHFAVNLEQDYHEEIRDGEPKRALYRMANELAKATRPD